LGILDVKNALDLDLKELILIAIAQEALVGVMKKIVDVWMVGYTAKNAMIWENGGLLENVKVAKEQEENNLTTVILQNKL
jgi:hypothetical protein